MTPIPAAPLPGPHYFINVRSPFRGRLIFCECFPLNQIKQFEKVASYCTDQGSYNLLSRLIYVIRTDSVTEFCKDLLLPNFAHARERTIAASVNQTGFTVLRAALALLDLATIPVRLITLIPRHLYNVTHSKKDHPLYRYLTQAETQPESLNHKSVIVTLGYRDPAINAASNADNIHVIAKTVRFTPYYLQNSETISRSYSEGVVPNGIKEIVQRCVSGSPSILTKIDNFISKQIRGK